MTIVFACFSPHPPILLPDIGSSEDRKKVKKTIRSLEHLAGLLKEKKADSIIISSPHPDWGFNVPLYFLAKDFKGEIKTYLTGSEQPKVYFEEGRKLYRNLTRSFSSSASSTSKIEKEKNEDKSYALIASGDLSHCLKKEGPYGFHPQGPEFDRNLIEFLEKKVIENFLQLDEKYPEAGECGLRSFSFLLGVLEESKRRWRPEILSYEAPFGVGYLVVNFKL